MKKKRGAKKTSKTKISKKSKPFFNKKLLAVSIVAFLALVLIIINVGEQSITSRITGSAVEAIEPGSWFEIVGSKALANAFHYMFGKPLAYTGINATSAAIVTIAIWLLLFLTFSDIIATFSSFSKWVSWSVGFLIAIVAANIGLIVKIAVVLTGIFAFAGVFAVYAALGAALVAFFAVNLGLWRARKWVLRRQAMMAATKAEAGGRRLKGTVEGLGALGEALERIGGRR